MPQREEESREAQPTAVGNNCPGLLSIDSDVANDPYSAANTAVPAEFASRLAVERFICNVGRNNVDSLTFIDNPAAAPVRNWFSGRMLLCLAMTRRGSKWNLREGNCRCVHVQLL